MSIDVLAQVVADAFQFLELSDDEVVDPDAAVAQRKRQALAAATARLAAGQSDGRVRALLQELPAHLGTPRRRRAVKAWGWTPVADTVDELVVVDRRRGRRPGGCLRRGAGRVTAPSTGSTAA